MFWDENDFSKKKSTSQYIDYIYIYIYLEKKYSTNYRYFFTLYTIMFNSRITK